MKRFVSTSSLLMAVVILCLFGSVTHAAEIEIGFVGKITDHFGKVPKIFEGNRKITGSITYETTQSAVTGSTSAYGYYTHVMRGFEYAAKSYQSSTPYYDFQSDGRDAMHVFNNSPTQSGDVVQMVVDPRDLRVHEDDAEYRGYSWGSGLTVTSYGYVPYEYIRIDEFVLEFFDRDGKLIDDASDLSQGFELDEIDSASFLISIKNKGYVVGTIEALTDSRVHTLPEPTSALLLGFGISGFALRRKRRRGC